MRGRIRRGTVGRGNRITAIERSIMKQTILNRLQQITEQNLADIEQAKAEGRSAIGFYCLYSPMEIAVAAAAISLPLCGT
jgi:benzoyl-CoA reductase/2-hydroxyglutaryl-CoA dehydratase subunit BcrC/BadD/HgdB